MYYGRYNINISLRGNLMCTHFSSTSLLLNGYYSAWLTPVRIKCLITSYFLVHNINFIGITIQSTMKELQTVDFMPCLPPELAEQVFSYLDATSICSASQCSHKWRIMADSNKIWSVQFVQWPLKHIHLICNSNICALSHVTWHLVYKSCHMVRT